MRHIAINTKRGLWVALSFVVLTLCFSVNTTHAANVSITGGSNGSSCNSGGYFDPSSKTINSGDTTITFHVPSNDPYDYGIEIHGFPEGTFTVSKGGSHTTSAITSSFSYYGVWPSAPQCPKGSGSITVNAPAPAPAPTPTSTPSTTATTTKTEDKPAPTNSNNISTKVANKSQPTQSSNSVQGALSKNSATKSAAAKKSNKLPIISLITGPLVLGAGSFIFWRVKRPKSSDRTNPPTTIIPSQ